MNPGLLIILINVGAWLAFFIGVYIAIFRHVRRHGRIIMLSGVALVVALVATLVALLNPSRRRAPRRSLSQPRRTRLSPGPAPHLQPLFREARGAGLPLSPQRRSCVMGQV
jgi:hypothetical protein